MIALLSILLVVTVSGDEQVEGILGGSVLLPCSCSGRDTTLAMKWQMDEKIFVFMNEKNVSKFNETYRDRASVLLEDNCSLVLNRIKKEDQGKYKCIYRIGKMYKDFTVRLIVVAHFSVCQRPETHISPNKKSFQCDVSGYDKEAEIQWYSDGQPLTNSSETTITPTYTLGTVNGLTSFRSNLMTHLNMLKPKCEVMSENVTTNITEICSVDLAESVQPNQERYRYIIIIPCVMAAGLCVVLWCWRKI